MNWNQLKKKILPLISPDEKELGELHRIIIDLKNALDNQASILSLNNYRLEVQGSTGEKQTFLKGSSDIDLFVILDKIHAARFLKQDKKKGKIKIRKYLANLVQDWFVPALKQCQCKDVHVSYAEHPYVSARKGRFEIDVVGCFGLTKEDVLSQGVITAVDRTPLHTNLIKSSLNPEQIKDVRLLKSFFIACRSYGDRAAVGQLGFTGFSAEILIYRFKSIEQVFTQFHTLWQEPIDFFKRSKEELLAVPSFAQGTLIIIDPTDPTRNLAASISERSYGFVNYKIKKIFKDPSPDFFLPKPLIPLSDKELKECPATVVLEFRQTDDQVHYTEIRDKLYSFGRKLARFLELERTGEEKFGPSIFEVYFEEPMYSLVLTCEDSELPKTYLHQGPPPDDSTNLKKFLKKHPTALSKDGTYWVEIQRPLTMLIDHVSAFLNLDYVKKLLNQVEHLHTSDHGIELVGKKALALLIKELIPFIEEMKQEKGSTKQA